LDKRDKEIKENSFLRKIKRREIRGTEHSGEFELRKEGVGGKIITTSKRNPQKKARNKPRENLTPAAWEIDVRGGGRK